MKNPAIVNNKPNVLLVVILFLVVIILVLSATIFDNYTNTYESTVYKEEPGGLIGTLEEDDPRLIETIRKWFMDFPPAPEVPYRFENENPNTNGQIGVPAIVDKLLGQKQNGFYVECGAHDGEYISNSLFFELERNWTGLLIEPNYRSYTNLRKKNRKAFSINACLTGGRHAERLNFINADVFGGVADIEIPDDLKNSQNTFYSETATINCFPLISILLSIGFTHVDYFSLDIEGGEWTIVQTFPWDKIDISIVGIETNHLGSNYEPLLQFMDKQGYAIFQQVKFDTIFVKKTMMAK